MSWFWPSPDLPKVQARAGMPAQPALSWIEADATAPQGRGFLLRSSLGTLRMAENTLWLTYLTQSEENRTGVNLRLTFPGAHADIRPEALDRTQAHVSYLLGNDPAGWRQASPLWSEVRYRDLYPGIDLVVEVQQANSVEAALPWRLEARSTADLSRLRLRIEGASSVAWLGDHLRLETDAGPLDLPLPYLEFMDSAFDDLSLPHPSVGNLGPQTYEVSAPFIRPAMGLQPLLQAGTPGLVYSTLLGGAGEEVGYDLAVDSAGNTYLVGSTTSTDFPASPGAFDTSLSEMDAFVAKINPQGSALLWATFLGGSSLDRALEVSIQDGNVYLAGETRSPDFPLSQGLRGENDAFVASLSPDGATLRYARLLGGTDQDVAYGLAVAAGEAYITGLTYSSDFPATRGTYRRAGDLFVSRLNSAGEVVYTALQGGLDLEAGFAIAVQAGNAFVAGETYSPDWVLGAFKGQNDVFALKLDGTGGTLYKTLVGGSGGESSYDLAVDSADQAYLTGTTTSTDFPVTAGSCQGNGDVFLARLDASGKPSFSTCLGGNQADEAYNLALSAGSVILAGTTASDDFPVTTDAYQPRRLGAQDAFLARLDLSGSQPGRITYASYLGGSSEEQGRAVAVDSSGQVYLAGYTRSADYPTSPGALDRQLGGSQDAFVALLVLPQASILPTQPPTRTPTSGPAQVPSSTPPPGAIQSATATSPLVEAETPVAGEPTEVFPIQTATETAMSAAPLETATPSQATLTAEATAVAGGAELAPGASETQIPASASETAGVQETSLTEQGASPTVPTESTAAEAGKQVSLGWVVGLIILLVVVAGGIWLLMRRK